MIEKSAEMKIHEQADAMMHSFRQSVRNAQQSAKESGIPVTIVVDKRRYNIMPNGEIQSIEPINGE
jgi:hypothetical protein